MAGTGPKLVDIGSHEIQGVRLRRHPLDRETARLFELCRKLGASLTRKIGLMPDEEIPDENWRENFRSYAGAMAMLLREQRERSKLAGKSGMPKLSDEEFESQLAELAKAALLEMPQAELNALLKLRLEPKPVDVDDE